MDFDKELFFDLVDKDMVFLPPDYRISQSQKYIIDTDIIETLDSVKPNMYLVGNAARLDFFKHIDSIIRAEFTLQTPLSPANANLKSHILNTQDSVFLHIRRGDYLSVKRYANLYVNLCDGKYYDGAIRLIKSKLAKPHIFIFSNDIAWCEREFLDILSDECKEGVEFEFMANNGEDSAVQEMELMRSCQNAITANSTFSWWASYLIDNPHKIVAMQNQFFKNKALCSYYHTPQIFSGTVLVDSYTGELIENAPLI